MRLQPLTGVLRKQAPHCLCGTAGEQHNAGVYVSGLPVCRDTACAVQQRTHMAVHSMSSAKGMVELEGLSNC
jgi:hypothetical protein